MYLMEIFDWDGNPVLDRIMDSMEECDKLGNAIEKQTGFTVYKFRLDGVARAKSTDPIWYEYRCEFDYDTGDILADGAENVFTDPPEKAVELSSYGDGCIIWVTASGYDEARRMALEAFDEKVKEAKA